MENKSICLLREAYAEFENPAVLWSMGKDSTAVLWLCRKAFFGKIPFPAIHIDTRYKFKQMYEFRDRIAEEWGLDLVIARNEEASRGQNCGSRWQTRNIRGNRGEGYPF